MTAKIRCIQLLNKHFDVYFKLDFIKNDIILHYQTENNK